MAKKRVTTRRTRPRLGRNKGGCAAGGPGYGRGGARGGGRNRLG